MRQLSQLKQSITCKGAFGVKIWSSCAGIPADTYSMRGDRLFAAGLSIFLAEILPDSDSSWFRFARMISISCFPNAEYVFWHRYEIYPQTTLHGIHLSRGCAPNCYSNIHMAPVVIMSMETPMTLPMLAKILTANNK